MKTKKGIINLIRIIIESNSRATRREASRRPRPNARTRPTLAHRERIRKRLRRRGTGENNAGLIRDDTGQFSIPVVWR